MHFVCLLLFFSATAESGRPLFRELGMLSAVKENVAKLCFEYVYLEFLFKLSQVLCGFSQVPLGYTNL